jgi:hypothetical protein
MSKNKKKKLKKKAKKLAELREIQMQQMAEVGLVEQLTTCPDGASCPPEPYDFADVADDRCVVHWNGSQRLTAVEEEEVVSPDQPNHVSSLIPSSPTDTCNGHHYPSHTRPTVSGEDDYVNACPCSCEARNRLERSDSALVTSYREYKASGLRRVASCPGIYVTIPLSES